MDECIAPSGEKAGASRLFSFSADVSRHWYVMAGFFRRRTSADARSTAWTA
jgi:hypothetical protein